MSTIKEVRTVMPSSMTYSISEEVLYQEVNGEVVLLSMTTGKYYGLNEVATRLWHLFGENGNFDDAVRVLLEEYDVSEDQLRADLSETVDRLVADGLLISSDDKAN